MTIHRAALLLCLVLPSTLLACAAPSSGEDDSEAPDTSEDEIRRNTQSPPYVYEGPLPAIENPELTVSIVGHTLRVTGLLPASFDNSKLPYYATSQREGTRQRLTVVYPVATGKKIDGAFNNVPGVYDHLNVRPYRPNDASRGKESWGGLPFLNYHDDRRFAFHGPIDYRELGGDAAGNETDWRLRRGRISAGCQRMQGEHLLELTHMLGFDMRHPHSTAENAVDPKNGVEGRYFPVKLTVLKEPAYDMVANPARGNAMEIVDVAYPKEASVPPLPAGRAVRVFPTWDANEQRAWACEVRRTDNPNIHRNIPRADPSRFNGSYCARTNGANHRDPRTGARLAR